MTEEKHEYRGWTITIEAYESDELKKEIEADSDYPLDNNLFYDYCVYREEPEEAISFSEFSDKEAAFDDAKITIDQFIEEEEKLELKCECGSTSFYRTFLGNVNVDTKDNTIWESDRDWDFDKYWKCNGCYESIDSDLAERVCERYDSIERKSEEQNNDT